MNLASFQFEEVDQLQELLSRPSGGLDGWDIRVTQIQRGVFSGSYRSSVLARGELPFVTPDESNYPPLAGCDAQIQSPSVYVAHYKYGRLLHFTGQSPLKYLGLIIPLQQDSRIRYKGQPLEAGNVFALTKPNQEIDFVTHADIEFLSVQLGRESAATLMSGLRVGESEPLAGIITPEKYSLRSFIREIRSLLQCQPADKNISLPSWRRGLEAELIEQLSIMLDNHRPVEIDRNQKRCRTNAYQVRDYLEAHLCRTVSIAEICSVFQLRPRTLHYAFKSCFGVSPAMYHRYRRLQLVRKQLLCRNPANTTVTRLATEHLFFHLSRFAVDYKAVFGETPAHTLSRRA